MSCYLSLLADDGDSILQFDIMEKALQKNVGHSDQVVVLLRLIERVTVIAVCLVILKKKQQKKQRNIGISQFITLFDFYLPVSDPYRLLCAFPPVPVVVSHIHQFVL